MLARRDASSAPTGVLGFIGRSLVDSFARAPEGRASTPSLAGPASDANAAHAPQARAGSAVCSAAAAVGSSSATGRLVLRTRTDTKRRNLNSGVLFRQGPARCGHRSA